MTDALVNGIVAKCGDGERMLEAFGVFSCPPNSPVRAHVRGPAELTLARQMRRKHGIAAVSTQEFHTFQVCSRFGEMKRLKPAPFGPGSRHKRGRAKLPRPRDAPRRVAPRRVSNRNRQSRQRGPPNRTL